jgi:hypothetical protein
MTGSADDATAAGRWHRNCDIVADDECHAWELAADDTVAMLRTAAGLRSVRQGSHRPDRRAVNPQRRLPDPLGLALG